MQETNHIGENSISPTSFLALALLAPPVLWWAKLVLSLIAWKGLAEYAGGNVFEIIILVVCPGLAAVFSFIEAKRTNAILYWAATGAGILLVVMAVLASFRNS